MAEIFGESTSLIRFWADKFPQYIKPERNKKGNRLFSQQDLQNFKTIHYLVKQRGMTLDGAAKRMKENKDGLDKNVEIIDKLDEIKIMLQQVYESL